MAKKTRKAVASKAKKTKTPASKKRPVVKARSKVAAPTKAKSAPPKKPAGQPIAVAKRPESFSHKVAGAFEAVVDTLVDAERLHHKLEPEISREPE
jgi:hypothetical protein